MNEKIRNQKGPCTRCGYRGKHLDSPPCTTCPAFPKTPEKPQSVYVLLGEDLDTNLIDDIHVYLSEQDLIRGFEEQSSYTWEQYLNHSYSYEDCQDRYFYRVFEVEIGE